jgi:hypothetical protein
LTSDEVHSIVVAEQYDDLTTDRGCLLLEAHQKIEHLEDLESTIKDVASLDERRLTANPVHVVIHQPRALEDRYETIVFTMNVTDRYDALSSEPV